MSQDSVIATIGVGEQPVSEFLNREVSWLNFNRRVLYEALDERTPLLERVAFLAIFNSNLDEYYQKRVGGLKRQIAAGVVARTPDGMTAREQLATIRRMVLDLLATQAECYTSRIKPMLAEAGIHLLSWQELSDDERAYCNQYFRRNLFPILTPLSVDPGHPFPFLSNLSTSLGVLLRHAPRRRRALHREAEPIDRGDFQFARVKVPPPPVLPQWVRLAVNGDDPDAPPFRFIKLEEIIRYNLGELFPGMTIESVSTFRVTRNADVERDEEDAEDLLELIEQEVKDRRFASFVRLEMGADADPRMTKLLLEALQLDESDVYYMPAELDYTDLWTVHELNLPELKYEAWQPAMPPRLADNEADIFSIIRAGDVLVHHPYESFNASVERFIRAAANDPKVVAIKQTLYRTSAASPFIPELIRAAEAGKQVACLVELKARFDEERNLQIAQMLEKAGVHVVYGLVGFKTHTKTAMVVRHEADGMRVYAHIGTGNYNSKTASLYTDLGLFTCDEAITSDVVELFHYLTGRSEKRDFRKLLIAPVNMRKRFIDMIDREMEHAAAWQQRGGDPKDPARPLIIAKMNQLEDKGICRKLYDANSVGVRIKLIVRGFCCLRPGVPGLSENITVMSVIGRFLEHSRIFYFNNGGAGEYYIGSADWMYRNLNNRVECITPIEVPALAARLKHVLDTMFADQRQTWDMQPDGSYVQRQPNPDDTQALLGTHARLIETARREAQRVTPGRQA